MLSCNPVFCNPDSGFDRQPSSPLISPSARVAIEPTSKRIIGTDHRLVEVLDIVKQAADTNATVLIAGESGTGKELVARLLHDASSRARKPFIAVNCGAIAETLQEAALFGYEKGAFTGATARGVGKFEAAQGGTIFLDEISEMSCALQIKLLRILQTGEYSPVGAAENRYCSVRVVAATNQDLQRLMVEGYFRRDLYYRLNVIRLELPPLRERRGDLELLLEHFLQIFKTAYQKNHLALHPKTKDLLLHYDYPGNVREMENILHRAVIVCRENSIAPHHLPPEVSSSQCSPDSPSSSPLFHAAKAKAVEEFERNFLSTLLQECGGIVSRAAHRSGLSERNFHEKLKKYGIVGKDFRAHAA